MLSRIAGCAGEGGWGAAGETVAGAGLGGMAGVGPATGAAAVVNCRRISAFANSRALALQPGQLTLTGIRPLTGSTSKAKRVPHEHSILTFILHCSRR